MRAKLLAPVISAGLALALLAMPVGTAAAAPPSIDSESVSGVTPTNATLEAEIDPNGLLTKYKLQIDTTGHFKFDQNDSCALHPPGIFCAQVLISGEPLPAGLVEPPESSIPAGYGDQPVSVDLSSIGATLQPGTTYHYRAIAANGITVVEGPDQTFTTPSGPAPPSIDREWASEISQHNAILNAEINPNGRYTSYEFQIDGNGTYNYTRMACPLPLPGYVQCLAIIVGEPLPEGLVEPSPESIPASYEDQHVSIDLSSIGATLQAGSTYHFRVIATNNGQIVTGPDQTFTTAPAGEPPPPEPPSIEGESVSGITQADAVLEAEVNLHGAVPGAYFQFQLASDPSEYASEILCPPTLQPGQTGCNGPTGAGGLPIGFLSGITLQPSATSHASLDLANAGATLQPGTTYHYRVLVAPAVSEGTVEWEEPTVYGDDQTFTTAPASEPPPPEQPSIESEAAPEDPASGDKSSSDQAAPSARPSIDKAGWQAPGPKAVGHCSRRHGHRGLRHRRGGNGHRHHQRRQGHRSRRFCGWVSRARVSHR